MLGHDLSNEIHWSSWFSWSFFSRINFVQMLNIKTGIMCAERNKRKKRDAWKSPCIELYNPYVEIYERSLSNFYEFAWCLLTKFVYVCNSVVIFHRCENYF